MVKAETILLPAFTAEFVMLEMAVIATTCKDENLACTDDTAVSIPDISKFLAAAFISVKPLVAPVRLSFCLSLSSVDMVVAVFLSKSLLLNRISTIRSSIVLLID